MGLHINLSAGLCDGNDDFKILTVFYFKDLRSIKMF